MAVTTGHTGYIEIHNSPIGALSGLRACGFRETGGLYLEVGIGWNGKPVSDFIVDPPRLVHPQKGFPLPAQGMGIIMDPHGVWHLIDRVGICHYPYPADFVEEAKVLGVSRRTQKGMALLMLHGKPVPKGTKGAEPVSVFKLLTKESRLILVHDRAFINNYQDYLTGCPSSPKYHSGTGPSWKCPKGIHDPVHFSPDEVPAAPTCAGLWWQDYSRFGNSENGKITRLGEGDLDYDRRRILRIIGSASFYARRQPDGTSPQYAGPAVFMSLPIGRFVLVKTGNDENDAAALLPAALGVFPAASVKS